MASFNVGTRVHILESIMLPPKSSSSSDASNRGDANNIAIFSIGKDGKLKPAGHQSSLGIKPRNFNFDPTGNFLLVANQDSDNIVIFKVDKKTGSLTALPNQISVPNPVCVKWVKG